MKNTILNTILLLALYHDLDRSKESIVRVLQNMETNAKDRLSQTWHQTVLYILSLDQNGQRKSLPVMVGHCAACMSSKISALNNIIIGSGWIYLWLQDRALDGQFVVVNRGLLKCLELIEKDPSTLITPSHELQIMCHLYMMRSFLSLAVPDERILFKLEGPVRGLMCWSNPVGHHAIDTFNSIMLEQKSPGYALRRRFALSDTRFSHRRMKSRRASTYRGTIHIVVNITCHNGGPFQSLLQCGSACLQDLEKITTTKLLLCIAMLETAGERSIQQEIQSVTEAWLFQLPNHIVSILYDSLLDVMEDASQVKQVMDAVEIRRKGIMKVWHDLKQAKNLGHVHDVVPKREVSTARISASRIQPFQFIIKSGEPKWRPVSTKVIEVHSQPGPMLARYSRTGAEELLMDVIANSPVDKGGKAQESSGVMKEIIRMMIAGGDGTLHYILAGYVGLTYSGHLAGGITTSGSSHSIDMLFYLLPLGQNNTLATYIAQRDLWYDATIYRPLVDQLPAVPHMGQSKDSELMPAFTRNDDKEESRSDGALSGDNYKCSATLSWLFTRQVENYLLEGSCLLKLSIYNCEGWYNNGIQNYHCTIPFVIRAEMGLPAASVSSIDERKISHQQFVPRRPLDALDEDSLESFATSYALRADAIFRPIDWAGKEGEEKRISCSFVAIQAISVPKPCEMRLNCDPCSHFLDICFMESEGTLKRVKVIDDITKWVSAYRANWLMVEAQDASRPFDVLLDGELYGPFYRIRLSPCPHPSNRRYVLKFPVMTYWPTQISRASC